MQIAEAHHEDVEQNHREAAAQLLELRREMDCVKVGTSSFWCTSTVGMRILSVSNIASVSPIHVPRLLTIATTFRSPPIPFHFSWGLYGDLWGL